MASIFKNDYIIKFKNEKPQLLVYFKRGFHDYNSLVSLNRISLLPKGIHETIRIQGFDIDYISNGYGVMKRSSLQQGRGSVFYDSLFSKIDYKAYRSFIAPNTKVNLKLQIDSEHFTFYFKEGYYALVNTKEITAEAVKYESLSQETKHHLDILNGYGQTVEEFLNFNIIK